MSETQMFIQQFLTGFELSDGLYLALVVVLGIIAFGMFALWTRSSFAGLLAAGIIATSALWATVPSCLYVSDCLFGMPRHFAPAIAMSPMLICFTIGFAIWCFKTDRREASNDRTTS